MWDFLTSRESGQNGTMSRLHVEVDQSIDRFLTLIAQWCWL